MRAEMTEKTERTIEIVRHRAGNRRRFLIFAAAAVAFAFAGLAFLFLVAHDRGHTKVMVHDQAAPPLVAASKRTAAAAPAVQPMPLPAAAPEKTRPQNAFRLEKSRKAVPVGPLLLRLNKTDPKKGEYEISVVAGRRSFAHRHLKVNRPLWIALGRNKGSIEILATSIEKKAIEGFWRESEELPQGTNRTPHKR